MQNYWVLNDQYYFMVQSSNITNESEISDCKIILCIVYGKYYVYYNN